MRFDTSSTGIGRWIVLVSVIALVLMAMIGAFIQGGAVSSNAIAAASTSQKSR